MCDSLLLQICDGDNIHCYCSIFATVPIHENLKYVKAASFIYYCKTLTECITSHNPQQFK